jgi:histidine ammonia-lyase
VHQAIRAEIPHYASDRYLADELAWAKREVLEGRLGEELRAELFK